MALKVLTVDDSKTIRRIVKKAFNPYDCEIFEGENGVEGLSLASKERPDLIILDITMPVMTGTEMLEKLKGEPFLKDIPVIMLTAESGKDNVMQIAKLGVKDYMVKPFKGEQLIDRVTKIVKLNPKPADGCSGEGGSNYFVKADGYFSLALPCKVTRPTIVGVESQLPKALNEVKATGQSRLVVDLSKSADVNMSTIKLIILVAQHSSKAGIQYQVVGPEALGNELKGFQETSNLNIHSELNQALAAF
ncbi:MAG: response regulator [Desulfobacterales bacterium]|jgi:CheY-like chemotaxis protein